MTDDYKKVNIKVRCIKTFEGYKKPKVGKIYRVNEINIKDNESYYHIPRLDNDRDIGSDWWNAEHFIELKKEQP